LTPGDTQSLSGVKGGMNKHLLPDIHTYKKRGGIQMKSNYPKNIFATINIYQEGVATRVIG